MNEIYNNTDQTSQDSFKKIIINKEDKIYFFSFCFCDFALHLVYIPQILPGTPIVKLL